MKYSIQFEKRFDHAYLGDYGKIEIRLNKIRIENLNKCQK